MAQSPAAPVTPDRLTRSSFLSTFAHHGAVYLFHDLYGYLLEMSADVLAVIDAFEGGADVKDVVARFASSFEGQSPQQFVDVFYQHACLIEPGDDERAEVWPFVPIKGRWNVWRRDAGRVTLWTAWGDAPIQRIVLDELDTKIWDDLDGEVRMAELREAYPAERVRALVERLTHSDVQAVKLCMFPKSTFAKRPQLQPAYLASTMPYRRWTPKDGAPWGQTSGDEISPKAYYEHDIEDAEAQFDHEETTLSHLLRRKHPALRGRTYGAALVDAVRAQLPTGRVRVLEIGAGLGYVAEAVIGALRAGGAEVEYTIAELSPKLKAAQQARLGSLGVTWRDGDVLALDVPDASFDWILSNEMVGDLPALRLTRADLGLDEASGVVDPAKLAALGRAGELVQQLGIYLDDATDPLYLMTGAFELVTRIARWLAPDGLAVITEFGERAVWPKLSTHLDHPELSIHFNQLAQAAQSSGLTAKIEFVIDLLEFDREQRGLATTRSHFRALRAMLAEAGVTLDKIGYTPALLADTLGGNLTLDTIGELRWDKIEDRLMGLVPHEFKALLATKPPAQGS